MCGISGERTEGKTGSTSSLRTAIRGLFIVFVLAAPVTAAFGQTAPSAPVWRQQWDELLGIAKREGRVVVFGPVGDNARQAFVGEFQKVFPGVSVEYTGGVGPALAMKVTEPQKAGRYVADVFISGPQPGLQGLKDRGLFQALRPNLILPEVSKPESWWRGKLDFIDREDQYYLAFWAAPTEPFLYNTEKIKPDEIGSWWDIIKPEFKGKIVMYDPMVPGPVLPKLNHFLHEPGLGERYIRALLASDLGVTFTRDFRQLVEWVGRGGYWIGIGANWFTSAPLRDVLPVKFFPYWKLREGTFLTSSWGNVALLTRAPHPNAAKVYINWLLSKDGQTAITRLLENPSGRVDVPEELVPEILRRRRGAKFFVEYHEAVVSRRVEAQRIAREVFGR